MFNFFLFNFYFKERGYPDSAVTTGKHRAQEIDGETALQFSQKKETDTRKMRTR